MSEEREKFVRELGPHLREMLADIECQWENIAAKAIADVIAANPAEEFYAAAFWLFYADYTKIAPPCLAINSESYLLELPEDQFFRWNPPDWKVSVLTTTYDAIKPAYYRFWDALAGQTEQAFVQIDEEHKRAIARVCRRLTDRIRSGAPPFQTLAISPNFVVGIFEGTGYGDYRELLEASVASELIEKLKIPLF